MYAIIADGGNQYRVEEGQILSIQRRDLADGETSIDFDRVLMVGDVDGGPRLGQPVLDGATVSASVLDEYKDKKITIHKFRRRKGYHVKQGHRQRYLRVKIDKINA